jgi:3-phosphoshikimate 1-carboxyvinyltransferase
MSCLTSLGATFEITGSRVKVNGIKTRQKEAILDANESGSTLRFLIPLSLLFSQKVTFKTSGNLINRPLNVYEEIFKKQQIKFEKENNLIHLENSLHESYFELDGNVSSQFISGLLFALPLLKKDSYIKITSVLSSKNYIFMTMKTLRKFNIEIFYDEALNLFTIPGNQVYQPQNYQVEKDFSQASFFLALGCINKRGMTVKNLDLNSLQPDKNIISILSKMGAKMEISEKVINVFPSLLKPSTISLEQNPDLGPILMGLASFVSGQTTFTHIKRLRIKESDRLEAMRYNLDLLGIKMIIDEANDCCIVDGGQIKAPNIPLKSFHDHRIFMALAIICHQQDIYIDEKECLNKSFPTFLEVLNTLKEKENASIIN